VSVCLDSWGVLAWLRDEPHAGDRVDRLLAAGPAVMSWVNAVEVYYQVERAHSRTDADQTLRELRRTVALELPGTGRMVDTARLKAAHAIALGDCFAIATATAHNLPLATGDPEILDARSSLRCELIDLRAPARPA
jgi:uncharacterized protein with PIN domain